MFAGKRAPLWVGWLMADLLDVLTYDEALLALGLSVGPQPIVKKTVLEGIITGVSRRLDKAAGPVVRRTVTEVHDGGRDRLYLRAWPVAQFTTVTQHLSGTATVLTAETFASQPTDSYLAEPFKADPALFSGRVDRRSGGSGAQVPAGSRIEVVFIAGRYTNTASVDELFKTAARVMLQNFWHSQEPSIGQVAEFEVPQQLFPRFAIPNAVRELLADHWQEGPMVA